MFRRSRRRAATVVAAVMLATSVATIPLAQGTAYAQATEVLPLLKYGNGARLPLSVVGAGVAGAAGVTTGVALAPALAGAAATAAAAWAGSQAIQWAWQWATSTPTNYGDAPTAPTSSNGAWSGGFTPCRGYNTGPGTPGSDYTCVYTSAQAGATTGTASVTSTTAADTFAVVCVNGAVRGGAGPGGTLSLSVCAAADGGARRIRWFRGGSFADDFLFSATAAPPSSPAPGAGTTPLTTRLCQTFSDGTTTCGAGATHTRGSPDTPPVLAAPAATSANVYRVNVYTTTTRPDGSTVTPAILPPTTTNPAVPSQYPDCANYTCSMTLTKQAPDGQLVNCTGTGACPEWSPDTYPAGTGYPDGSVYTCKFGPYVVAQSECKVLPGAGTSAPAPSPGQQDDAACIGAVSWNPVSWVLVPVKCALQWAFVPAPTTFAGEVADVRTEWEASFPAAYLDAFGDVAGTLSSVGANAAGCGGPSVTFDTGLLQGTYKPLDACPGSMAHNAAKVVRLLLTFGLYLGAAALSARILAASFGLNLPGFGRGDG